MFGVATADALFSLNDKQLEYGIESDGRNRIIFDFVSANFELHQREIFSAIVNDYTDWQVRAHSGQKHGRFHTLDLETQ